MITIRTIDVSRPSLLHTIYRSYKFPNLSGLSVNIFIDLLLIIPKLHWKLKCPVISAYCFLLDTAHLVTLNRLDSICMMNQCKQETLKSFHLFSFLPVCWTPNNHICISVVHTGVTSESLTIQPILASGEVHTLHFSVCTKKSATVGIWSWRVKGSV